MRKNDIYSDNEAYEAEEARIEEAPITGGNKLTVLDLFSGAGGIATAVYYTVR